MSPDQISTVERPDSPEIVKQLLENLEVYLPHIEIPSNNTVSIDNRTWEITPYRIKFSNGQMASQVTIKLKGDIIRPFTNNLKDQLALSCFLTIFDSNPLLTKVTMYRTHDTLIGTHLTGVFYTKLDSILKTCGFKAIFGVNNQHNYTYFIEKLQRSLLSDTEPKIANGIRSLVNSDNYVTVRIY